MLIAGGSGLIGKALQKEAQSQGWEVTILSRSPGIGAITWTPHHHIINLPGEMIYDAIINLAGNSVAEKRWTAERKKEIYSSRINACRTLELYLRDGRLKTSTYIGASGIGIYGDHGKETVTEETLITDTDDWFVNTVVDWEKAHSAIAAFDIRTIIFRIGIVLSRESGALFEILKKSNTGVLTYFGKGHQIWPWIHIDDIARMMMYAIDQQHISGTFIAAGPAPVTNKELILAVDHYMSPKKIIAGVPRLVLSVVLGEMHRVLFESCSAFPKKMMKEGFQFRFNTIDEAAKNLMTKKL